MTNQIQWFPGHMKSALEMIKTELKLCDIIIYMLDARCPQSCINPKYEEFISRKPVLFVLNKSDLAPPQNMNGAVSLNSTLSGAGQKVITAINQTLAAKIENAQSKGIKKTIRAIVIGVTNCGKSTFINNLASKGKTLTGDRPGVTRTKQWVSISDHLWLLDTPGTLWPKFDNPQVAKNLAYVGSIKDDILDIVALAKNLVEDLQKLSPDCIKDRFGANTFDDICRKRGYILKGGVLDEERCAKAILTEFRAGKLGRFNLDGLL
jgi:ribosome biogenesis GTPase A